MSPCLTAFTRCAGYPRLLAGGGTSICFRAWTWGSSIHRKLQNCDGSPWFLQQTRVSSTYVVRTRYSRFCVEPCHRRQKVYGKVFPRLPCPAVAETYPTAQTRMSSTPLEIQHSGYLTLEARKRFQGTFPPWIVTNWGSDIYLFGRLTEHEPRSGRSWPRVSSTPVNASGTFAWPRLTVFQGRCCRYFPMPAGFSNISLFARLRQPGRSSARRLIMLKGYRLGPGARSWACGHWSGARTSCADTRWRSIQPHPKWRLLPSSFPRSTGVPVSSCRKIRLMTKYCAFTDGHAFP